MQKESRKLTNLVQKSQTNLLEVSSVFPFDFFPDTLRVNIEKVDIISREFFFMKHMFSVLIKDINTVTVSTSIFFATLNLEVAGYVTGYQAKPEPIRYLFKKDAIKARRMIMGLIVAKKEKIDLTKIKTSETLSKIEELGKSHEFTQI